MTAQPSPRMILAEDYARQFGATVERVPHDRRYPSGKRFYRIVAPGFTIEVHALTWIVIAQVVCKSRAEADDAIRILVKTSIVDRQH